MRVQIWGNKERKEDCEQAGHYETMATWSEHIFEEKGSEKKCYEEKKPISLTFFIHKAGNLQPNNTVSHPQRQ
jgi:hypothetical protein